MRWVLYCPRCLVLFVGLVTVFVSLAMPRMAQAQAPLYEYEMPTLFGPQGGAVTGPLFFESSLGNDIAGFAAAVCHDPSLAAIIDSIHNRNNEKR